MDRVFGAIDRAVEILVAAIFAAMCVIGLLQEGAEDSARQVPSLAQLREVRDTEELLPLLDSSAVNRVDARSFLTGRFLDFFHVDKATGAPKGIVAINLQVGP